MPYSVEADGRFAYAIDLADTTSILLQASKPKSAQKGAKSNRKTSLSLKTMDSASGWTSPMLYP
jgi:hypothetical protein